MKVPIEMPNPGMEQPTVRLVAWLREVGDRVGRGDPLAEVETEKAIVEVEALTAGVILELLHEPGDEVPVGGVLGFLEDGR